MCLFLLAFVGPYSMASLCVRTSVMCWVLILKDGKSKEPWVCSFPLAWEMDMVWLADDKPDLKRRPKIWSKENNLSLAIKMATTGSALRMSKLSVRRSHRKRGKHTLFTLSFLCSLIHCIIALFITVTQKGQFQIHHIVHITVWEALIKKNLNLAILSSVF